MLNKLHDPFLLSTVCQGLTCEREHLGCDVKVLRFIKLGGACMLIEHNTAGLKPQENQVQ